MFWFSWLRLHYRCIVRFLICFLSFDWFLLCYLLLFRINRRLDFCLTLNYIIILVNLRTKDWIRRFLLQLHLVQIKTHLFSHHFFPSCWLVLLSRCSFLVTEAKWPVLVLFLVTLWYSFTQWRRLYFGYLLQIWVRLALNQITTFK